MNWNEFKLLVKKLRYESNRLSEELDTQIWCTFIYSDFDINPYRVDLRTGEYFGKNFITGVYQTVNLKFKLKQKG